MNIQTQGIRLNEQQEALIWECFHALPEVGEKCRIFTHITTSCPPLVQTKNHKDIPLFDEEMQLVIQTHWLPWLRDVYANLKMFGVCPWHFVKLPGTAHRIPVVPPFQSGFITTYMDKNQRQAFSWYWTPDIGSKPQEDTKVYFEQTQTPPMLNGMFRSPIASLLPQYILLKQLRQAVSTASHRQVHPELILEYNPPRNVTGDDNLVTLGDYGERVAGAVLESKQSLQTKELRLRQSDLLAAIRQTTARNYRPISYSSMETQEERDDRELSGILAQAIPLPPYYSYKSVKVPTLQADITKFEATLREQVANAMDVPESLFHHTGSKTRVASENDLRFVNETLKWWLRFFETLTLKALLSEYGTMLQSKLNEKTNYRRHLNEGKLVKLNADVDIEVQMQCTPIIGTQLLKNLYLEKSLPPDAYVRHLASNTGIPSTELLKPPVPPSPFETPERPKKRSRTTVNNASGPKKKNTTLDELAKY